MTDALDAGDQNILDKIAEHGWYCMGVLADDQAPAFAYTIGFWESLGAPEFVICGLPHGLMHNMLWETFRQIKDGKTYPNDHVRWSDLIEGFDCISRPVHPSQIGRGYFSYSMWHRRLRAGPEATITAYQLFWPSKTTWLYPWDADCSEDVRNWQPLLYSPNETGLA